MPPRKWARRSWPKTSLSRRFNEAGAFPPRKSSPDNRRNDHAVVASMRPGRFHPGNPLLGHCAGDAGPASMRPGRFHPGNSLCETPCAAWASHTFCERWLLCLLVHANCFPNAYHNTTYLLVIQIESALRELPALFLPLEHSQGTRQTLLKQSSPADSALHTSCPDFLPEDQLGQQAPNPKSECDPLPI